MLDRHHDEDDVWEGLRLTGVAVGSAVFTATLVIFGGGAILDQMSPAPEPAPVIRAIAHG